MIDSNPSDEKALDIPIIATGLAPYRITLLNRLSLVPRIRLSALLSQGKWHFQSQAVGLERARFPYQVFGSYDFHFNSARADATSIGISPAMLIHLVRTRYDLMVGFGWTNPSTLFVLLLGKLRHIPVVLWETSIPHPPGRLKRFLMPLVRRMIGAFDGYFVPSTLAAEYFISMGARTAKVTLLPQVIDSAAFARAADGERAQRAAHKAAWGITTPQVILFVGQLTVRKGLDVLLEAFQRVSAENKQVSLLLVGEGPMQAELEARVRALGLEARVFFSGYIPRAELPRFYAMSDVFVLPSWYDTFGVVILEAMSCGLPVITTSSVGAAQDLVREGENGFVVEYGDVAALANALAQTVASDTRRAAMGNASLRLISGWNLELAAKNFEKAVLDLVNQRTHNNHV